jgi:hypothetical protein
MPTRKASWTIRAIEHDKCRLLTFINEGKIQTAIAIEVTGFADPRCCGGRSHVARGGKSPLTVVPQQQTLAAFTVWNKQVDGSIAIQIGGHNRSCRLSRQRVAGREATLTIVDTDETRHRFVSAAIGDHNVRITIPVEVGEGDITCAPGGVAEGTRLGKAALSIVLVDELAIRRIVADN